MSENAHQHRPLTPDAVRGSAPLQRLGRSITTLGDADSTNLFLLADASRLGDGAIATAEFQTAGRGRLGRTWLAPRGSSILLSVLLHEIGDSPLSARATLIGAVAACEAVEITTDVRPMIRWPNDLAVNGRKLGGILAETSPLSGRSADLRTLVIGVGINCLQHAGHFPPDLADKATSLEIESTRPIERAAIAAALVARLDAWLSDATTGSSGNLLSAWQRRCGDFGARVTLQHDGQTFTGTVVEVADTGDLIVQLDAGGRRRFAATTTTRAW